MYTNISGLNVNQGAFETSEQKAHQEGVNPDFIVLVDDQTDDEGKVIGTYIRIKVPHEKRTDPRLTPVKLRELAERFTKAERLFGGGYDIVSQGGFGGHLGIICSPRSGSGLTSEQIWGAVMDFFDAPRYSETEWKAKAENFAQSIGVAHVDTTLLRGDAYRLPRRAMELGFQHENIIEIVTIYEEDLPLYEDKLVKVAASTPPDKAQVLNSEIMSEKTETSEPEDIVKSRDIRAQKRLKDCLLDADAERIIACINDLNPATIAQFDKTLLLSAFEVIAHSDTVIDYVWNKDNMRFRIVSRVVPDWAEKEMEQYKKLRYDYLSLPRKIDTDVVISLYEHVATARNNELSERFGDTLVTVLSSSAYRASHAEVSYDSLLPSVLRFITDKRIDAAVRTRISLDLARGYGEAMNNHWKQLSSSSSAPLLKAVLEDSSIASQLHDLIKQFPLSDLVKQNTYIPESQIIEPEERRIQKHIHEQEQLGLAPYVTLHIQIGRDVEGLIKQKGIYRLEKTDEGGLMHEQAVTLDSVFALPRFVKVQERNQHGQLENSAEIAHVCTQIVQLVKKLQKTAPEAKIRLIRGGFPNVLSGQLATTLMMVLGPKVYSEKIVYADLNMQTWQMYDTPSVPTMPENVFTE